MTQKYAGPLVSSDEKNHHSLCPGLFPFVGGTFELLGMADPLQTSVQVIFDPRRFLSSARFSAVRVTSCFMLPSW